MSRDVLSAAAADAFEIRCDSSKPDGLQSPTHISGSEWRWSWDWSRDRTRKEPFSESKRVAQRADFIAFPITRLLLEAQLDVQSVIEQYCLHQFNIAGKVFSGGSLVHRRLNINTKKRLEQFQRENLDGCSASWTFYNR